MKIYEVILTRDVTESVMVTVTAENENHAQQLALEDVPLTGWEMDDCNDLQDPYTNGADEVPPYTTRADLMTRPAWQGMNTDLVGNPAVWLSSYTCDHGHSLVSWQDEWSCQCDDECPRCGASLEAESEWVGPPDPKEISLWESLPEAM